ncbi:hypothetical protein BC829DRAFT_137205 [Chytridium lagenaria]|nr:hypothetical protein BC829DRAFT_137205 [Chytridium lagenaria]
MMVAAPSSLTLETLPEDVLTRISSLLHPYEIARLHTLSRKAKAIWSFTRTLSFAKSNLRHNPTFPPPNPNQPRLPHSRKHLRPRPHLPFRSHRFPTSRKQALLIWHPMGIPRPQLPRCLLDGFTLSR